MNLQQIEYQLFKDLPHLENIKILSSGEVELIAYTIEDKGYFGFCKGDFSKNHDLIDKISKYKDEHNLDELLGPLNFSTYNSYRICANTTNAPYLMEPDNDAALLAFLTKNAKVSETYLTYEITDFDVLAKWATQFDAIDNSELEKKYEVKAITSEFWLENLREFYKSSDDVFGENLAYGAIPFEIFEKKYSGDVAKLICEHTSLCMIEKSSGDFVGIALNFKDPMAAKRRLLIKTLGMAPDHRMMGMTFIYLLNKIVPEIPAHYDEAYLCLMRKGNLPSLFAKDISQKDREYLLFTI